MKVFRSQELISQRVRVWSVAALSLCLSWGAQSQTTPSADVPEFFGDRVKKIEEQLKKECANGVVACQETLRAKLLDLEERFAKEARRSGVYCGHTKAAYNGELSTSDPDTGLADPSAVNKLEGYEKAAKLCSLTSEACKGEAHMCTARELVHSAAVVPDKLMQDFPDGENTRYGWYVSGIAYSRRVRHDDL